MQNGLFFQLLRIGLGSGTIDKGHGRIDNTLSVADYQFAVKQGVGAFIYDGLQTAIEGGIVPADAVSREVKMGLFSHTVQVEGLCKKQYQRASELSQIYAENDIRTIVLKGIAVGVCYPNLWRRPCGDFDCFLMGDYDKGNVLAEKAGAKVEYQSYKHSHIEYRGLMVENHQFCTALRGNRRMKRFEQLLMSLLREEKSIKIGATCMESPSPLFNALFLTHHGREHFVFEGIALRHLCDWGMLVKKYGDQIDWKLFSKYAKEYDLKKFADAMMCLSEEYLGIGIPSDYDVQRDEKRDEMLRDSMVMGVELPDFATSLWHWRWQKVLRLKRNIQRFRLFMNVSFTKFLAIQLYGILFDRIPKQNGK